jgi:peptide deformylase
MSKILKYIKGDLIECEVFKLVDFYDAILRQPTTPFDFSARTYKEAQYIAYSLTETLEKNKGLGLSANQVGLKDRVCVINMGDKAWVMFNPYIVEKSEDKSEFGEGCLSYPGLYLKLQRPNTVKVRFQAIGGEFVEHEFSGLTSVCVQHELDHLDGIVYTDRISPIKLEQAKRKVKKTLKKIAKVTAA